MTILRSMLLGGAAVFFLTLAGGPTSAAADGPWPLVAQQNQPGMPGPGGMSGRSAGKAQGQQPGGMAQPAAPGGNANGCMQNYQRCVMMCAGVANCINNCNVGYAVCTNPQGPRPGGS